MSAAPLNAILKIGFGPLKDKIVSYDILDKNSLGDIFNHTEAFFSHKNGILWGRNSLTGQPVLIDPYDKSHSNYNFCISGISGVGKSASVKMMMSRLIEMEGYRFAVIDFDSPNGSEGEYVPLVRMEGGVVYQLAHNTENILNPFDIDVESDYEPKLRREVIKLNVMEKISDCTDLLLTMIKDGKNIEDFADDVHLSKLIRETISELYDELEIKEGYPDSLYVEGTDLVDGKLVSGKVKKKMPSIHRAYIKILYKKKYNKGLYPEKTLDVALAGLSRYVRELYYSEDSIGVYTREAYEAMQKDENGFKFVEIKLAVNPPVILLTYGVVGVSLLWLAIPWPPLSVVIRPLLEGLLWLQNRLVAEAAALPCAAIDYRMTAAQTAVVYLFFVIFTLVAYRPWRKNR